MKLSTNYLGFKLRTPLVPSASPLSENHDNVRRMEDAGASAIVFHSLFEEQLTRERRDLQFYIDQANETAAESLDFYQDRAGFKVSPDRYLQHIAGAKAAIDIPVIASLNGTTFGGWMKYAQQIEQAGADALELNLYNLPSDPDCDAENVEQHYVTIIASIKAQLDIPVAVKLSPFFTNLRHFA